jgi:hypothetical protein
VAGHGRLHCSASEHDDLQEERLCAWPLATPEAGVVRLKASKETKAGILFYYLNEKETRDVL